MTEEKEKRSDAWFMIQELGKQNKRIFIALITVVILWFATIGGFVWYLSSSEIVAEVYDVTQDTTDGGNANYIGSNGDIVNGTPTGISD